MKKVLIAGSGGHMKEQFEWLKDFIKKNNEYEIKGFLSNKKIVNNKFKLPTILEKNLKIDKNVFLFLAIGDPLIRQKIFTKFNSNTN